MSNTDRYFNYLLDEYYHTLINTWDKKIKKASKDAIKALLDLPENLINNDKHLRSLEYYIRQYLGEDFAHALDEKIKVFSEVTYRLSAQEPQFRGVKFSFTPVDLRNVEMIKKQQVFWLKNYYDGNMSNKLSEILTKSVENKWTKIELSEELRTHFSDLVKGSKHYFEGLAEHTSLRVREFARLNNYQKCGATRYQIVAVMDERTSDICRALNGQIFELTPAIKTMESMFKIADCDDFDTAKARLKELAPFVTEKQIEYKDNIPVGIRGDHTPFPPFHWRCRTRTVMIFD
jgi:SPP1 gp7 family putative phage head morphogenesis protein